MIAATLLTAAQASAAPGSATAPAPATASAAAPAPAGNDNPQIAFTADAIDYDQNNQIVTATGNVILDRAGRKLRADTVTWNQKTGEIRATGAVAVRSGEDQLFGDDARFSDDLTRGTASNVLLTLGSGGRLAAASVARNGDVTVATAAAYSPCDVTTAAGCPKTPTWFITAARVTHDPVKHRIYYRRAALHMLGHTVFWLPRLSHPDGSGEGRPGGLLVPVVRYNSVTGLRASVPYYIRLAPDRDLTITPTIATAVAPVMEARYRQLTGIGAFQIDAIGTLTNSYAGDATTAAHGPFRGYLDVIGRFQLDPSWSVSTSIRLVTDKSFLRLYEYSNDDRLRSTVSVNRITSNSLLTIQGWETQTMVLGTDDRTQPLALPLIDYRRHDADPLLGGTIETQLNTLALTRAQGQDTQRAFAAMRWDLRGATPLGQVVTLTAFARGDVYHTSDVAGTSIAAYRGLEGWSTRGIVAGAIDVSWPLVGAAFGGTQVITPRVQLVASPRTANASIPDEDSRVIDLDDVDLFALNRFSGYDRWEDDTRLTYGAEWSLTRPRLRAEASIGQSYRFTQPSAALPAGTGLAGRFSDIVGRVSFNFAGLAEVTDRFRLDKDDMAVRRNEVDVTVGGRTDYVTIAYLKLNRNISETEEDLRDSEEVRVGGNLAVTHNWSVFGSSLIDLTSRAEDPTATGNGFAPVRQRAGVQFDNDCLRATFALQRNYDTAGGLGGTSVLLSISLRNLGR